MELHSVSVNWRPLGLYFLEKVDTLYFLPLDGIVIVINQDGFWPSFSCHLESGHYKFVVAAIAAKRLNQLVARKTGMIAVAAFDGLVDHFNHFEIGVMFLNGVDPICPSFFGFVNIESP